jgi:putative peptidoglycan lipid II flippase
MEEAARRSHPARIAAVAALLGASVFLSRVLGYVREIVIAYRLGATPEADAYRVAFQIPDLLNHLLAGGAFSIAFVPLYTRLRTRAGQAEADALLAVVLGTMTSLVTIFTLILWFGAQPLIGWLFSEFTAEQQALVVRLTRIVLPAQICFVAGGVIRAVLMASDRFGTQAAAPLVYNAGIILGGLLGAGSGAEGFAWGVLGGAAGGQLVLSLLDVRAGAVRLGFRFAPFDRRMLGYLALAAPLMLGMSLLTVDEWYQRYFGQFLSTGSISRLAYARQLMLLPVAVVGQAIATAALPTFSRLASQGKAEELARTLETTLRAALGLALVGGAALSALAQPVVAVVFERGAFGPDDTAAVAGILRVFAWAVPAWVTQQIAASSFFARGDTWRPMLLGTGMAVAALPLYLLLGPRFGVEGLAAAGVLGIAASALATLWLAHRLHRTPRFAPLGDTLLRAGLAAACGTAAALAVARFAPPAGGALGALAAGGAAFALAAAAAIAAFGDAPTRGALRRVGARVQRLAR